MPSKIEEFLAARKYVQEILERFPRTRDSDRKLVSAFWYDELIRMNLKPNDLSGYDILKLYADGKLTPAGTITRARRFLKEKYPKLGGTNGTEEIRQKEAEQVRTFVGHGYET